MRPCLQKTKDNTKYKQKDSRFQRLKFYLDVVFQILLRSKFLPGDLSGLSDPTPPSGRMWQLPQTWSFLMVSSWVLSQDGLTTVFFWGII